MLAVVARIICGIAIVFSVAVVPVAAQKGSKPNQPPQVVLTAPMDGAVFQVPASIVITADASDPEGPITDYRWDLDGDGSRSPHHGRTRQREHTCSQRSRGIVTGR